MVGRVRSLGILRTGDPALDRVQDHVKQQLDPILQNPLLSAVDFRCIEVQGADPATAPTFALQYRGATTQGAAPTWATVFTVDATGAIVQPGWIAPTFANGWVNFGAGTQVAGYTKDTNGWVHLRGTISTGTLNTAAFVLPSGYRPAATRGFTGLSNGAFGQLNVDSSGNVTPVLGSNANFSLDQAHFDTRS
jgi:hypothetical protein